MQQIVEVISVITQIPSVTKQFQDNAIATQTEISAVHTPQVSLCTVKKKLFQFKNYKRPRFLLISLFSSIYTVGNLNFIVYFSNIVFIF